MVCTVIRGISLQTERQIIRLGLLILFQYYPTYATARIRPYLCGCSASCFKNYIKPVRSSL